jgi:enolase-phosphatase E1
MIAYACQAVVLDIEGTISPLSFVHDVLFPYARRHAAEYLRTHWNAPELRDAMRLMARDVGMTCLEDWLAADSEVESQERILSAIDRWMEIDAKLTGLKAFQGLVWDEGYRSGQLQSLIFPDVPLALAAWTSKSIRVAIYSSGSIAAQKAFLAHADRGDLLPYLSAHFDTTTGPKKEAESYRLIARQLQADPSKLLFISDVHAELDAARESGWLTALALRPGNAPLGILSSHAVVRDFAELELTRAV